MLHRKTAPSSTVSLHFTMALRTIDNPSGRGNSYNHIVLHDQVTATLGDTYNNYQSNSKSAQEDIKKELLSWLSAKSFRSTQAEKIRDRHEGTGDWLLKECKFKEWKSATSSKLLWCHGKLGSGKTVLASRVVEHLQAQNAGPEVCVCNVYLSYLDSTFMSVSALIRAFLDQFCRKLQKMPEVLLGAQDRVEEPADVSNAEVFTEVADSFKQVFIVIDGLDECPEKERSGILDFIAQTVHPTIDKACFKMFVSSRRDADINAALSSIRTPVIELEAGRITPDIKKFVREEALRFRATKKLVIKSDDLLERVIQELIENSDGMFLWVRLQLDQLCRASIKGTDYHVEDALSHLPQDLTEMYERIFDGIAAGSLGDRDIAMECFRWVLYAKESILGEFLLRAIALMGSPSATPSELQSKKLAPVYVSEACGNLLSIANEYSRIKLIHFSVDEFLRKVLFKKPGGYWEDLADRHDANFVLACRCIDLLLLAGFVDTRGPELDYAVRNFDTHVLGSIDGSGDLPPGLRTRIDQLLSVDADCLEWLWLLPTSRLCHMFDQSEPRSSSWLVWATELCNIPSLNTIWPNLARPKCALLLAIQHGEPSVLELLLSEGLDIHETDRKGRTALSYASEHNNQPAIDLLLQRGAKINTGLLHEAVINDNIDSARKLLIAGADVDEAHPPDCEVPSMRVESLAMARMLCEEFKADLKINDARGKNALFHLKADPFDDKITAIFEYFVKQGADVTATTPYGMNILDHAVRQDRCVEKVQFLLKHYPQSASKQENQWTALHWACKRNSPNLDNVEELVCHGVNASTITTTHPPGSWTPLDIMIHYSRDWRYLERQNQIHGLGGPTTSQTVALATGDGPSVDVSVADYNEDDKFRCSLCRLTLLQFRFNCTTCHQNFCLMCNDRIHSRSPDHEHRTTYRLLARDRVNIKHTNYEVQVPHLFDPHRPDWKDWLGKLESRIIKEESERLGKKKNRVTELGDVDGGAKSADKRTSVKARHRKPYDRRIPLPSTADWGGSRTGREAKQHYVSPHV